MTADSIIRMAYAQLRGLKENIPDSSAPGEFIELYHKIVDDLEGLGGDLSRFRVPISPFAPMASLFIAILPTYRQRLMAS
ncbi:MAG: hypothetical protein IH975_00155 [Nitrospinae bacterium]|nr:hypothetical protein [Nitrospinota bacterium]